MTATTGTEAGTPPAGGWTVESAAAELLRC